MGLFAVHFVHFYTINFCMTLPSEPAPWSLNSSCWMPQDLVMGAEEHTCFLNPFKGICYLLQGAVFMSGLITFPGTWSAMPSSYGHRHRTGPYVLSPKGKECIGEGSQPLRGCQGSSKTLSPDSSMSSDNRLLLGPLTSSLGPRAKSLITLLSFWETKLETATPVAVKMTHFKTEKRTIGKVTVTLSSVSQHFPLLKTLIDLESVI